ncbi:MAG: type II secretion system F family protein [Deltaproteobacteria bacterium]|nr:type II secretion system F family protein [Deltaproteobacteria bacterium]
MTIAAIIATTTLVALAVFMAVYAVSGWVAREITPPVAQERSELKRPYLWTKLTKRIDRWVPTKMGADLRRQIMMAGGLEGMTAAEVALTGVLLTGGGLTAGLILVAGTDGSPWWIAVIAMAAAVLPFVWLRDQVKRRHLEILRDLPFHLDLLTLSVEAGLDFSTAVGRMVEKGKPGPLREEFNSYLGEIRMGKTRAEAMEAMGQRVGLPALSAFLASLIQADRLGSGLGRTLRLQAEQLRTERFQRAEKLAGEAPVKMLIPMVIFIFPTIWLILFGPLVFEWVFVGVQ